MHEDYEYIQGSMSKYEKWTEASGVKKKGSGDDEKRNRGPDPLAFVRVDLAS